MNVLINVKRLDRYFVLNALMFAMGFSLFFPKVNVIDRIFTSLTYIFILAFYREKIIKEILEIPRDIKIAYLVLWGSMLIASVAVGDANSIKIAVRWIQYFLPFLTMYFLGKIGGSSKYALCGFVLALMGLVSMELWDYIRFDKKRLGGLYNPNFLGTMFDVMIPMVVIWFLEIKRKQNMTVLMNLLGIIGIVLGVVALFLTGSRGAVLGITLGLVLSVIAYIGKYFSGRKFISVIIVVLMTAGVSLYTLQSMNGNKVMGSYVIERVLLVKSSFNMWQDHKLFGVGLANWREMYRTKYILSEAKEPNIHHTHNVLAHYFSTTGVIGGCGFVIFLLFIIKYLYGSLSPVSDGGLYCVAMLWAILAVSFHGMVDIGIAKESIYRLFCGCLGLSAAMIETVKLLKNNK